LQLLKIQSPGGDLGGELTDMDYQLLATLTEETREDVGSILRGYNRARNPTFFAARELPENAPKPLNVVASDPSGKIVGGLIAATQFAWLKVSVVAVAEHVRRQGVGRQLMELAERKAVARGCRHAFLDTMEYQAPDFYQKLGYQIAGKLDDWDSHGHAQFLFTKQLSQL
jgi:ribosomal protein S18 acetylase RimI-like enzyme